MKKLPLLLSIFTIFSLASCSNKEDVLKTFISEVYVEKGQLNSLVEVALNQNDKDYTISFYRNKIIQESVSLKDFNDDIIIFSNNSADEITKHKANYVLSGDYILGNNYIEIKDKKGNVIDSVGNFSFDATYISEGTLIKRENKLYSTAIFYQYDWYKVSGIDSLIYLGNLLTPLSEEEFNDGPHLEEKYFNLSYYDGVSPLGGLMEVSVTLNNKGKFSYSDGDTTIFNVSDEYKEKLGETIRVRYFYINTPEIDHSVEYDDENIIESDPRGEEAATYVVNALKNAKHILLQSPLGSSLHDTYKRILGLVWYTNKENPTPKDYNLLNYEVVKECYSRLQGGDELVNLTYKGIPYHYYLEDIDAKNTISGKRVYGEKDPDYNY